MFDPRLCLNPNHPDVKKWIDNVGKENMYKVFVQNNYLLPDYESYKGAEEVFSKNIQDYKKFLDKLLPSNQFEFDVLDTLKNNGFNILGTAAFFQKTFYFKNRVTKNELAEEAFHAIVQTLMSDDERTQIYNAGRELLNKRLKTEGKTFNSYISELEKLFPNVNKETLEQFAYEEEIAKDFVNYYNSEGKTNRYSQERVNNIANKLSSLGKNALPIAELIHRLFERIKALFNLTSNEKEVEMLFKKISNGNYRNTKIVNNNDNVIPSFAVYKNRNDKIIPSDEVSQMKRSIAVLAKNLYESEGIKLTQEQSINQAIENYINFLRIQVKKVETDKKALIKDLINLLRNEDPDLIEEITDQFEANKTIFDEVENDEVESKEDEVGSNERFEDNANQQSPETRSKELKILMNTTGTVQGRIYVDSTGETKAYQDLESFIITDVDGNVLSEKDIEKYQKIDVLKIADEKLIYSAIVRRLSNISDEKKRFIELMKLSMFNKDVQQIKGKQDNENSKTFINRLLKDILGSSDEETKEKILIQLETTNTSLSDVIKADTKPLHVQRFLLALRGFNLASRNVYRVEIDLDKGWGKFSNVDAGSKKSVQKTFWDSNYRLQQDKSYEDFKKLFNENYLLFNKEYKEEEKNIVNLAQYYNNILELLGVDVSGEYLLDFMTKIVNENYPLLYTNKVFTLEFLKNRLDELKLKLNERTEYPDLYKGDDTEVEIGEKKENDVDFNSFFNFIAEGNVDFDERVIESSYRDGYGNSIYNHQLPTFTLKFGNSFKTLEDFEKLQEGGIIGVGTRLDKKGKVELIKSTVLDSFKKDNPLVDDLTVNGEIREERLKKLNIYTLDTTQLKSFAKKSKGGFLIERDSEYISDNVIGLDNMSGAEYALTNMIIYTEGAKKFIDSEEELIIAPVSLGQNEASKQQDYFTIFHDKNAINLDGTLGEKTKKRIVKLIKTEFDKIKENSELLKIQIKALENEFKSGEITRNNIYDLTAFTDVKTFNVYENYNTGEYKYIADGDYYKAVNKKGLKGIQFSPEVLPFVDDNILNKALQGLEFNEEDIDFKTVMDFLAEEYQIISDYGLLDKLPHALRESYYNYKELIPTNGENTNEIQLFDPQLSQENRVKSFLLNYWIGSTMSNRMRYGSHNFNFKIDSTDPLKRYRMFNGATLSAKTSIVNKELGIYEPITHVTYGTIEEPKGISDINPQSKPIDRADAAMRATPEGVRRILHGMAKLNKRNSDILDKIEQGVELTPEEWNIMVETDSYISAMKPLAANGEQTIKTGLTPVLNLNTTAYYTILESSKTFEGKKAIFEFDGNKITVDEYGRTTQFVGNTREIIWDNTNKVFKEWKAKPIDKDLILYSQRMFLRGFRKEDGIWVYKGKQYEIDTLVPPSALKTGQRNILPFVKENNIAVTNFDFPKEYNEYYTFANAIDADFFGQQVENPQGKVKITSPTQNIEILANEQFGDIVIRIIENGKTTEQKISSTELQEYYQKLLANRNLNGKNLAVAELFKDGKPDYTFFFDKLKQGLKLTGGSGQDYEFLEVNEDGSPKYNVNIPLNKDKMIQYVLKHFSTGVLSHKVAGNSYVLASDYGMKSLKKLRAIRNNKGEIIDYTWDVVHRKTEGYDNLLVDLATKGDIKDYDLSDKIYDHRAWQIGEKDKSELHSWFEKQKERLERGEEVYFIDGLRYMKKSYTKDGKENGWVSEAMMPKLNAKQTSISEDIRYGTGVRIPSQDKQSAISLEWVDFLDDTLGNTIVVPKEIVQIAGSDFDIDKSYVTQYEGYWENGEYYKYKDTFEDYKKYLFKTSKPLKKALKDKLSNNEVYQANQTTKKELLDLRNKLFNDINFITEKEGLDLKQFKSKVNAIFEELKAIDLEENFKIRKELKEKLFEKNKNLINLNEYVKFNFQEIKEINKKLDEVDENIENEILKEQPIVLKQFGLVSSEKQFKEEFKKLGKNESLNNAVLNNKILDTQRALLTSDDVLFGNKDNPARGTGDTPMDLSLLENLQKESFVLYNITEENKAKIQRVFGKDIKIVEENNQYKVYPFIRVIDEKDVELLQVFKNKKIPHNALTVHSNYQQGTIIARKGIGIAVNGLLQAIVANRIGLKLTDKFQFSYNGNPVGFTYKDHRGDRVFEVKNTIVSATTDEAKEEQLKRHGIKGDDLNVIDILTNFGFSIDESIAIVNSKLVKKYKDSVTKNNLTKNQKKTEEQIKFDNEVQNLKFSTEPINLTQQEIFEGLYKENTDILTTYLKLTDMAKELAKLAKLIKGKKGYTKGKLSELTDIQNTAVELGLISTMGNKKEMYFDWSVLDSDKAADIKSFVEITQDLTKTKLNQMFIEYETISQELKDTVLSDTNNPENTEISDKIEKDVNTFMISQMIKDNPNSKYDYLKEFLNINKLNPINKTDNFLDEFFKRKQESKNGTSYKLLKHLLGVKGKINTVKNSESLDSIRLASISKLNPAQQDNIRNLFLELMYSDNKDEAVRNEEKLFAQNLFAYFVLKDGLQFRQFNISKIFPTEMFKDVSEILDDFKTYTKRANDRELKIKFKQLWFSDIRNKKYRQKIKDGNAVEPYRMVKGEKTKVSLDNYDINKPALYLEIKKTLKESDYSKSEIKTGKNKDGITYPKLPLYIDYKGASYKKISNSDKVDVITSTKTYPLRIREVENQLDENEKYELVNTKNKVVFTVITNGDKYEIYDNEGRVVKGTLNLDKLSDPTKVIYIREPYYGSTIIDMMVDSGVIPAASEVVGKNGSKLTDLIEQLKEENTKKGYIQYYENLLLNRYSVNFDKSLKEETVKTEEELKKDFNSIKSASENSIKFNASTGETSWLSNFQKLKNPIVWDNNNYYTVEAFYQAMKTENKEERKQFQSLNLTGNQAKQLGKKVTLRPNWDVIKYKVMQEGIKQKFDNNKELKQNLINTGDVQLVEWNTWGDKTWGITANDNKGKNALGVILENQREIYKNDFTNEKLELPQETQPETVNNTIKYTPKGKETQTYTIVGNKIYNKNNEEVFSEDSVDRNKIFANLAVKQGRAVVVNYNDTNYVVNNKNQIISTVSGKIMEWEENNGNRIKILKLAKDKFESKNKELKQEEDPLLLDPSLRGKLDDLFEESDGCVTPID